MKCSMLFGVIFFAAASSCNNQTEKTPEAVTVQADTAKPAENKIMVPQSACYMAVMKNDTVSLKIEKFPNTVTGTLSYNFNEKDDNNGTIEGTLNGDTLIAAYTFTSEGKSSVRQAAFVITDSTAMEGFGPMEENAGKMMFKDLKGVNFKTGIKLHKIPCPVQ
jgi:hypothetical protein